MYIGLYLEKPIIKTGYYPEIDESKIVSSSAYVLFYKKRNTLYPNIEELYQKAYEEIDLEK